MSSSESPSAPLSGQALPLLNRRNLLSRSKKDLREYNKWYFFNGGIHFIFESALLVSTALVTLLSALGDRAPDWAVPVTAGIAFVVTGARQIFEPKDRWLSFSIARRDMQQALSHFEFLEHPRPEDDMALLRALQRAHEEEFSRFLTVRRIRDEEEEGKSATLEPATSE